jgi:hypothetical protein
MRCLVRLRASLLLNNLVHNTTSEHARHDVCRKFDYSGGWLLGPSSIYLALCILILCISIQVQLDIFRLLVGGNQTYKIMLHLLGPRFVLISDGLRSRANIKPLRNQCCCGFNVTLAMTLPVGPCPHASRLAVSTVRPTCCPHLLPLRLIDMKSSAGS